jgi:hypothetical protein
LYLLSHPSQIDCLIDFGQAFGLGGLKDTISKKMEDVNKALDDKDK